MPDPHTTSDKDCCASDGCASDGCVPVDVTAADDIAADDIAAEDKVVLNHRRPRADETPRNATYPFEDGYLLTVRDMREDVGDMTGGLSSQALRMVAAEITRLRETRTDDEIAGTLRTAAGEVWEFSANCFHIDCPFLADLGELAAA